MSEPERLRVGAHVVIYPRGKKRIWCADFWCDGRHCRQSLKTANKKVAKQRAALLDAQLTAGTYHAPPVVPLRQASEDYLRYLQTEHRSWSSTAASSSPTAA